MSRLRRFLGRFIGAYCPDEWDEREGRTNEVIAQAHHVSRRSAVIVSRAEQMLSSYQDFDRKVGRR